MAAKAAAGVASDVKSAGTYNVVVLKAKADGLPTTDNFELKKLPALTAADVHDGQVLVQVLYLSVDPYMRGRIGSDPKKSSSKPLDVGAVIVGATVGLVVASKAAAVKVGAVVHAYSGWREYYILPATDVEVCDTSYTSQLAKYAGGVLGMTGLTARYGIDFVGKAAPGQTVVVSGAAGAVGSVAGQLAKLKGCRVVGLAGSTAKCNYLQNVCGFDAVINYKTAIEQKKLSAELSAAAPKGVDVYFDNTGGEISDAVIPLINSKARIVVCGQIATYNSPDGSPAFGPRVLHHLLWKCATMRGFLVQEFEAYDQETYALLGALVRDGKLHSEEDIMAGGLQAAPAAFCKLFTGANNGKQVVRVSDTALALEAKIEAENAAAAAAAKAKANGK